MNHACRFPDCAVRRSGCPCWERQLDADRARRLAAVSPVEINRYRKIARVALVMFFCLSGAWAALTFADALPWYRGLMGHLSLVTLVAWLVAGRD